MASIDTLPSGKTRVRLVINGKRTTRTFDDADEARRFALSAEGRAQASSASGGLRLDQWAKQWYADVVPTVKPATAFRYKKILNLYVLPQLGFLSLEDITPAVLRGWQTGLAGQGLAPNTIKLARTVLGMLLRAAVVDQAIASNPLLLVKGIRVPKKKIRVLSQKEIAKLADSIRPRWRCMVLVAAYCGLRIGENCALRSSDLVLPDGNKGTPNQTNFNNAGLIRVSQTITKDRRGWVEGPAKTDASQREITVPPFLCRELRRHIDAGYSSVDFVFTGSRGGRLQPDGFRLYPWAEALRKAELGDLRFHDLRHVAVSLWIKEGASPKLVAARAGHSDIRYVFNTYGHLFGNEDLELAGRLEAAYGS